MYTALFPLLCKTLGKVAHTAPLPPFLKKERTSFLKKNSYLAVPGLNYNMWDLYLQHVGSSSLTREFLNLYPLLLLPHVTLTIQSTAI